MKCSWSCSCSGSVVVVEVVVVVWCSAVAVVYLSVFLFIYLTFRLSIYLPIYLSICLSISINVAICKLENEAILRDFLTFWTWQHKKRSNSARLPQLWKLTTSKTKQICENSFKNGKLTADLTALYQFVLRFFRSICLKYCACHEKVRPGHTKCCTCHQNATPLRKSAPWLLNISDEIWWTCLLHCACHAKCIFADPLQMRHACQRFWNCYKTLTFFSLLTRCTIPCACHAKPHLNVQKWSEHVVLLTCWPRHVLRATTARTFSTSQLPKAVRAWKCASRHNGVHFFDMSTSKRDPTLRCFVHFDFQMCFAPQRHALFRHHNFQQWSEHGVFCTFWLGNVLHATTGDFPSLIWPHGSAPAALASLLFDPPEPQIIGKTQQSRLFYLFAHLDLFSS